VGKSPLRIRMDGQARVKKGDKLTFGFNPAQASLFDAGTELRL
jgi:multiple sugar transport system ATP-binding protein